MERLEFYVCWYRPVAGWAVRQGHEICRTFQTREEAVQGAIEAAAAAREVGQDAVVAPDVLDNPKPRPR
jgi:hypothetical protein